MGQAVPKEDVRVAPQQPQKVGNILGKVDKKEDPEEELDSLEKKFEKLKQNFYQSADGLYHVMDPVTKQWKTQTEVLDRNGWRSYKNIFRRLILKFWMKKHWKI